VTNESPDARRIRQAIERSSLTLDTVAEVHAALVAGKHPIEALGAVIAAAGRDLEMTVRHTDEWAPDPPPGGWPGERVLRRGNAGEIWRSAR
jgi:hypothetical protein